jgi:two-component system sensor histidine kinase UhpB
MRSLRRRLRHLPVFWQLFLPNAAVLVLVAVALALLHDMLERLETERRASGVRMLSAQERERVRLARELHDEIGQSVTGLMLEVDQPGSTVGNPPVGWCRCPIPSHA